MTSIDYQRVLENLQAELAGVEEAKDKLQETEDALEAAIEGIRDFLRLSHNEAALVTNGSESVHLPKYPFKDMGIVDGAVTYLRSAGQPKKNKELVDALLKGGFPSKAKDPYITMRSVLMREMKERGTFTYNERKEWGLPEWQENASEGQAESKRPP